jgi:hypothetical protein
VIQRIPANNVFPPQAKIKAEVAHSFSCVSRIALILTLSQNGGSK